MVAITVKDKREILKEEKAKKERKEKEEKREKKEKTRKIEEKEKKIEEEREVEMRGFSGEEILRGRYSLVWWKV